ncbi:MAG: porin [Glaciecola sp.]|jgi:porin
MKFPLSICPFYFASVIGAFLLVPFVTMADENNFAPSINFTYSSDFLRNQSGGLKTGSAYIDYATLSLSNQFEFENGVNLRVLGSVLYANGEKFSETIVGDVQGASGSETGVHIKRIFEAYVDITKGNHSVLIGFFDTNTEFDVIESAGLFVNSAYGMGNTLGSSGRSGPSTYPFLGLSLRYQYVAEQYTFRTVISDGVPGDLNNANKLTLDLSSNDGYLNIAEFEYRQAQTKWLVGLWHYDQSGANGTSPSDNVGFYMHGERTFESVSGLTGFARLDTASSKTNVFNQFYSAGLVKTGFFESRSEDQIGIAFAFAELSSKRRVDDPHHNLDKASGELNIELSYSAKVNDWLRLQPSLQWIKNPSATNIDSASIIGLRLTIEL